MANLFFIIDKVYAIMYNSNVYHLIYEVCGSNIYGDARYFILNGAYERKGLLKADLIGGFLYESLSWRLIKLWKEYIIFQPGSQ